MGRMLAVTLACTGLVLGALSPQAAARKKRTKKPPAPMNKKVGYEAYKGTDVAMITYLTSRKEFRVGHAPYHPERFHVAEFVLVAEHNRKYLRPDFKAEIKMAPSNSKPELMANQTFQQRWKGLQADYEKLIAKFERVRHPKACKAAYQAYLKAYRDELLLAEAVARRMFPSQKSRARELLRSDLKKRFRARDKEWFDRLFEDFEREADLSKFFPRFVDLFVEPGFKKGLELAEKAMKESGVEYATAVQEQGDIID